MDKTYWENYYRKHSRPDAPSLFAEFVLGHYLKPGARLIEMGCGNGRDSVFFAQNGISVCGVDQVDGEVAFLNDTYAQVGLSFMVGDFTRLNIEEVFDCVYSRFTLHSVSEEDEARVLGWAHKNLSAGGVLCVEIRSINDPKLQHGERISENENIVDGHYRRYVDLPKFRQKLIDLDFDIIFSEESPGFAPYKGEDPPVIRIVAKK